MKDPEFDELKLLQGFVDKEKTHKRKRKCTTNKNKHRKLNKESIRECFSAEQIDELTDTSSVSSLDSQFETMDDFSAMNAESMMQEIDTEMMTDEAIETTDDHYRTTVPD